jgi:cell division protein FtsQ
LLVKQQPRKHYRQNRIRRRSIHRGRIIKQNITIGFKVLAGIALIILLSGLYAFTYDLATQCGYFQAQDIEIVGANQLTEEAILEQAGVYTGINILSVNLSIARKRLLAHPDIKNADVERKLPNSLIIRVEEYQPLAVVDLGRKFLMDKDGKIYKECQKSDSSGLPLITGLDFSDLGLEGKIVDGPYAAVLNILKLGLEPETILPNSSIREISVDREVGLTLYAFTETKAIKLGFGNYPDKYRRLEKVTLYLKDRSRMVDFDSIDLMNAGRIVVDLAIEKPMTVSGEV